MQGVFLSLPILAFTVHDRDAALAGLLLAAWGAGALAGALPALRLAARDWLALIRAALIAGATRSGSSRHRPRLWCSAPASAGGGLRTRGDRGRRGAVHRPEACR